MKKPEKSKKESRNIGKKIAKPFKAIGRLISKPFVFLAKYKIFRIIFKPFKIFVILGRYFKDSWVELKMVRWPDRKATWGLTVAVIIFSGFFVVLIVLLDFGFDQLFKLLLG